MRKKLLEEHLRTSEQELQQCRDKIADLEKQLEEYRQKEQAIAAARRHKVKIPMLEEV